MKAGSRVPTRRGLLSVVRLGLVVLMLASLPTPAFAAIGDLDTTFGVTSSGINYTEISGAGSKDWIHGLALQNDGMIVAVGEADTTFAVARYNTVGQLDTANFNPFNGFVTTAIGTASIANAVAVQNDGKIVVVGSSSDGVRDYFTVARYTTAGALDIATFNNPTGYVTSSLAAGSHVATAVVLQNDGKIVVAGYSTTQFVVARYTTTGALDTGAFNAPNGFRTINIGSAEQAEAVGLQADGKIILAGHADTGQSDDFAAGAPGIDRNRRPSRELRMSYKMPPCRTAT